MGFGGGSPPPPPPTFGSGGGKYANVYAPQAQPQADTLFQNILWGMANQFFPGGVPGAPWSSSGGSPGGGGVGGGAGGGDPGSWNSLMPGAGGFDVSKTPAGQLWPGALNYAQMIQNDPYFQNNLNYLGSQQQSVVDNWLRAQQGAKDISAAGNKVLAPFDQSNPYYQGLNTQAALGADTLAKSGASILNTAFDPQQALYQDTLNRLQQQEGAQAASSGVMGTPYGQAVADQATNKFNLDWQNQQLQRQIAGGQAGAALDTAAQSLAGMPMQRELAAMQGDLTAQAGAQSLFGGGLQGLISGLSAPSNLLNTQATNYLNAANQAANLGNNQYLLPQQVMNDLQSYLSLGQSASQIGGQLGLQNAQENALALQEQQNALSGLGNLAGKGIDLLGGGQGLSGLFGGGGGFGGTGLDSAAIDFGGGGLDAASAIDFGGGGFDALAATTAADAGGGFAAADLLPAVALS